jgi:hypothetical protein
MGAEISLVYIYLYLFIYIDVNVDVWCVLFVFTDDYYYLMKTKCKETNRRLQKTKKTLTKKQSIVEMNKEKHAFYRRIQNQTKSKQSPKTINLDPSQISP